MAGQSEKREKRKEKSIPTCETFLLPPSSFLMGLSSRWAGHNDDPRAVVLRGSELEVMRIGHGPAVHGAVFPPTHRASRAASAKKNNFAHA
jgi:hypothetical protein